MQSGVSPLFLIESGMFECLLRCNYFAKVNIPPLWSQHGESSVDTRTQIVEANKNGDVRPYPSSCWLPSTLFKSIMNTNFHNRST